MQTGNVAEGWGEVGRGFYARSSSSARRFTRAAADHADHGQHRHDHHALADLLPAVGGGGQGHGRPDMRFGKIDTFVGALADLRRGGVHHHRHGRRRSTIIRGGQIAVESAAQTAAKMPEVMPAHHWGDWARMLFAIGLFDAGLLGALCISLSTSWALGEVFGWAHSLNKSVREAPWFYVVYLADADVGRRRVAGRQHRASRTPSRSSCRSWPSRCCRRRWSS